MGERPGFPHADRSAGWPRWGSVALLAGVLVFLALLRSSPAGAGEPVGAAPPRPGVATAERPPSKAGKGGGEATTTEKTPREKTPREKAVKERGNVERDRTPSGGTVAGSGGGPAAPVRKEVVVRSPAYPGEIVAIGEFSAGGTIVLRRGKSPPAPIPR